MKAKFVAIIISVFLCFILVGCGESYDETYDDYKEIVDVKEEEQNEDIVNLHDYNVNSTNNNVEIKNVGFKFSIVASKLLIDIQNNSDKDLYFRSDGVVINNLLIKATMLKEVKANKQGTLSMFFNNDDVIGKGINALKIEINIEDKAENELGVINIEY